MGENRKSVTKKLGYSNGIESWNIVMQRVHLRKWKIFSTVIGQW